MYSNYYHYGTPLMGFEEQMAIHPQQVDELHIGPGDIIGSCQLHMQQQQQQLAWNQHFSTCVKDNEPDTIRVLDSTNSQSFVDVLSGHYRQQDHEIDQCLKLQSEQFKSALLEKTQTQMALTLKNIESRAQTLIQQKDHEIAEASKRTVELQKLLGSLETESHGWQKTAHQRRAMAISFNNRLEQLRNRVSEDSESCCENGGEIKDNGIIIKPCRRCSSDSSCMVFLPCRHLCSCKPCERDLESCPICGIAKKATIEALVL